MEFPYFPQTFIDEYKTDGTLLNHSRISPNNRARLFSWLSEECSKQKITRYSFALACAYLDLYFMKRNDVDLEKYQVLALGALILATKQAQIEGKVPLIQLKLFKPDQLLGMESKIVFGLDFYLNPPIYIELVNNMARIWDTKCENGQIQSSIRYFQENSQCYNRLKILYQKMDCLNLFKRVLDYKISEVVVTLFYLQTRIFSQELAPVQAQPHSEGLESSWCQDPDLQDSFQKKFSQFLRQGQISSKPNPTVEKMFQMLKKQKFPINHKIQAQGRTFTQILCVQTHNKYGHQFYRKYQNEINRL